MKLRFLQVSAEVIQIQRQVCDQKALMSRGDFGEHSALKVHFDMLFGVQQGAFKGQVKKRFTSYLLDTMLQANFPECQRTYGLSFKCKPLFNTAVHMM